MSKKVRVLDPRLEEMVNGLRAAGMRERNIYEIVRSTFRDPPSYRDLRAAFERGGLRYQKEVRLRHASVSRRYVVPTVARGGHYETTGKLATLGGEDVRTSQYREQSAANRSNFRQGLQSRRFTDKEQERLDRNYALGYAIRAYDVKRRPENMPDLAERLNPAAFGMEEIDVSIYHIISPE